MDQPEEGDSQSFENRILQELYPQIPIPFQRQPQNQTARDEAFTKNEIARIMQKVPIKKAPGYDGIDFIVLKTIFRTNPDIFITFYNKCLSLQCFPNPPKTGAIVLFLRKREKQTIKKTLNPTDQSHSFQFWPKYWRNCFWKDSTTTSEEITFNILTSMASEPIDLLKKQFLTSLIR
ncbi:hypothetical protein AVEN_177311-1 [Araneus ventricosus]|uniref:Reverse transcriptase domain-containing protein n=1 Tax=Araneus ventricosus TaxID=182803 RepID=A0A4Y2C6J4_ARAVE|nr:hypothetical protein AVEN_177311-1 [Araneus ventricosus]